MKSESSHQVKTIIFLHGNSQNALVWQHQLSSSILQHFNLRTIELPGHGESPRMENYTFLKVIEILVEQLNEEKNYVLIGHSLGGHFCIEALPKLKGCLGLLLCGTPPLRKPLNIAEAFNPDERMGLLFQKNLTTDEMEVLANFISSNKDITVIKTAIEQSDPNFRNDMGFAVANEELLDEVGILTKANIPIALVQGQQDDLVNRNYLESLKLDSFWKNRINYIKNAGHSPHFENSNSFNELILEFVNSIQKA